MVDMPSQPLPEQPPPEQPPPELEQAMQSMQLIEPSMQLTEQAMQLTEHQQVELERAVARMEAAIASGRVEHPQLRYERRRALRHATENHLQTLPTLASVVNAVLE